MKKLLLILSLFSLNAQALTHSKPLVSNQNKNYKWEIKAEGLSFFNKSLYLELSRRIHPRVSLGIQGGFGQSSDTVVEWISEILQKEEVVVDKDIFRVGLHMNFYAKSNQENSWFIGVAPTYERGYYQRITRNNVKIDQKKELIRKGHFTEVIIEDPKDESGKKNDDKDKTEKKPKTTKKWVPDMYRHYKTVSVEDPEGNNFGHHIKMPIRVGYQWVLSDGGIFATSFEAGIHQNLTAEESRLFFNVNLMLGLAL